MKKHFTLKSLRKFGQKISKRKEFFPSILIIIATIIIITIGFQFIKESRKGQFSKKDAWKTKTGLYIPVEIISFTPKSGVTSGSKIVVNGHGFTKDTKIFIGSTNNIHQRIFEAKIIHLKETQITADLPAHPNGKIDIFTTYNGNILSAPEQYEYTGAPFKTTTSIQIDSITPSTISISTKPTIQINGRGFAQDNTINFGKGKIKKVASQDEHTIIFQLPTDLTTSLGIIPITPAKYDLSVTTNSQESNLTTIELTK